MVMVHNLWDILGSLLQYLNLTKALGSVFEGVGGSKSLSRAVLAAVNVTDVSSLESSASVSLYLVCRFTPVCSARSILVTFCGTRRIKGTKWFGVNSSDDSGVVVVVNITVTAGSSDTLTPCPVTFL